MKTLRSCSLLPTLLGVLLATPTAGAFQTTIKANNPDVRLGRIAIVAVGIRGVIDAPDVRAPQVTDLTITPFGRPLRVENGSPDRNLAEAIDRLGRRIAASLDDPKLPKNNGEVPVKNGKNGDTPSKEQQETLDALKEFRRGDYVMLYLVQPERPGLFRLPSFTVTADGETAATSELQLRCTPAGVPTTVRAGWALSKPNPQVNEEVQLFVDVLVQRTPATFMGRRYSHLPLRNILLFFPALDSLDGMQLLTPLAKLAKDHAPAEGRIGFRIKGQPDEVLFDQDPKVDGSDPNFFRYRFSLPVRFTKAGTAEVPALRTIGEVYSPWPEALVGTRRQTRAVVGEWGTLAIVSEPLKVDVRGAGAN